MKANQLVLVSVLFTGLAVLSWAGPSPSWNPPAQSPQGKQVHACPTGAAPANQTCACCATMKQA